MEGVELVGLARLARYFFLLSQEKVSKKKATPCRLIPMLLSFNGRQAETRYAQTAACRKLPLKRSNKGAAAGDWGDIFFGWADSANVATLLYCVGKKLPTTLGCS